MHVEEMKLLLYSTIMAQQGSAVHDSHGIEHGSWEGLQTSYTETFCESILQSPSTYER